MSIEDFPARGRLASLADGIATFLPINTNYEFRLAVSPGFSAPVGQLVDGIIRVTARKLYSVPSGGNFVAPIFGPPRTIQGRVRFAEGNVIVVQAGVPIVIELPTIDGSIDLENGGIHVGSLINIIAMPGARFELLGVAAGK